jgi:hypothetical protein
MRNIFYLIIAILCSQSSFSQINDCSECNTKAYTYNDISHLSLLELKIIRNEIFARHQYVFKDTRLTDYYLENFTWYRPDYNTENNIKLNDIEKENISLLLKYETKKEVLKTTIVEELKEIKRTLIKDETIAIDFIINRVARSEQKEFYNDIKNELKAILSLINIDEIHWYNEKGLYKITTDDGHFISEISIAIDSDTVTLSQANMGYSELLNDDTAFKFGSDFDSTNEYASWYTFKIIDNELVLIEHQAAG